MNYFVYARNLLGVKTNASNFSWVYGRVSPQVSEKEFENCKIKIKLEVRKTEDVFDESFRIEDFDKYNYFYARKNENKIYYERNLLLNTKLRYSIEIIGNHVNVIINKNYFKYIKYKFMNLHSLGYILTDLISGILLTNGYATLHCSSVKVGGRTAVIFAPPGAGKTLTAINLCEKTEASFITEDIAITDGTNIYSVPWTSTFRFYNHLKESKLDKFVNLLKKKIPIFELITLKKKKSIDSYLGENISLESSKITDVIILGKGPTRVVTSNKGVFENILNLNKYEFNYHRSPTMLAMSYFNPEISIEEMYNAEKEIIKKIIDRVNTYKIYAEDPRDYYKIVINQLLK